MLVIGGCKLSLEREPHDTIEQIEVLPPPQTAGESTPVQGTPATTKKSLLSLKLATPARGATAHVIDQCLWVLGGCKGPKEHLSTV